VSSEAGREVLVVPVRPPLGSRWISVLYTVLVLNALLQAWSHPSAFTWIVLGLVVVASGVLVAMAIGQRRDPPRLVLDEDGIALQGAGVRRRHAAWSDVEDVRIHPPGGVRTVKIKLRGGATWQIWQAVRDEDVPRLTARWDAARRDSPA
jgi:hypothetical protein